VLVRGLRQRRQGDDLRGPPRHFCQKWEVKGILYRHPTELSKVRRHILGYFKELPIEGEYLHRAAFDIAEKYGKDTFLMIHYLGSDWLPTLFAVKGRFDALAGRLCLALDVALKVERLGLVRDSARRRREGN
jgi:D-lactate dehydrogenase, membrane binding